MRIMKIKRFKSENGVVTVIVALSIVALMTVTALTIDVGSLYEERRFLQTVADSAALAGVQELPENVNAAIDKAIEYASNMYDPKVVLIDGFHLTNLMIDNDIGVSKVTSYEIKKVDSDYFSDE